MNCKSIKKSLTLIADKEIPLTPSIEKHLLSCKDCTDYYDGILKSKELVSSNYKNDVVDLEAQLFKLKQKIHTKKTTSKLNIMFNNQFRKIAFILVLLIVIPIGSIAMAKISDLWSNKIKLDKDNITIQTFHSKLNICEEYPEHCKLLQERDALVKEAIKVTNKEDSLKKIDNIILDYYNKINDILQKSITVKPTTNKTYTDLKLLQNEVKTPIPLSPENFRFTHAVNYIDKTQKNLIYRYYTLSTNKNSDIIIKPLYISYSSTSTNHSTKFSSDNKFKPIKYKQYDGYVQLDSNVHDNFHSNEKYVNLTIHVFTSKYNFSVSTICAEDNVEENETFLMNIVKDNIE